MKLVFYRTGDFLEFNVKNTPFVNKWFEFLFDNKINSKYHGEENNWHTGSSEDRLALINTYINDANAFLKINLPDNTMLFENSTTLNQTWLNDTHRKWVVLTERYKNEIFDIPWELKQAWTGINNNIHYIELGYTDTFRNSTTAQIPKSAGLVVTKEDCDYTQKDLVLNYDNLGRHQFNQWEIGSELNEETSNYDTISSSFTYVYSQYTAAVKNFASAPTDYIDWCNRRNVEVLPPWVVLGRFKCSSYDAREIMHRNLKDGRSVGFEE
jgi:hypothetical protein